jgi:hypothetical protein
VIQIELLVSRDKSQRHETPIHPSTFYVKTSQEKVLLTCAAYISMHLAKNKSKVNKIVGIRKILEDRNRGYVLSNLQM